MNIKLWFLIHKWTSLICTVFLLMLCITGLPLIFQEEIEHEFGEQLVAPDMPADSPEASLDAVASAAQQQRPDDVIRYMFWDAEHHPHQILVLMASALDAPPDESNAVIVDARTASVLDEPPPDRGFMYVMLKLHVDLFAGLPGMLFLGFMGLLFATAIVTGVVLYAPFMRKLDFGTVRKQRSPRLKWLDVHNLLGVVTIVWALVVGFTGTINTLSQIVLAIWQQDQMAEMIAAYQDLPPPEQIGSVQAAKAVSLTAMPQRKLHLIAWPGTQFSSQHHYAVFLKGNTPLTSRLLQPALVDAVTGELTDTREMPWYVKTLFLSQPLHFGDYGGLPLKIIWTLLDILTIVVLGSGIYLWFGRRSSVTRRVDEIQAGGVIEGVAS